MGSKKTQTTAQSTDTNNNGDLVISRKFHGRFAALLANTEVKYRADLLDTVFHAGLKAIERRRKKASGQKQANAIALLAAQGYKVEKIG